MKKYSQIELDQQKATRKLLEVLNRISWIAAPWTVADKMKTIKFLKRKYKIKP